MNYRHSKATFEKRTNEQVKIRINMIKREDKEHVPDAPMKCTYDLGALSASTTRALDAASTSTGPFAFCP
jgi:hypothetical protein